ncbi:hypothetical protein ACFLS1_08455 [Verrucomicrobiota bacterium]
MRHKQKEYTRLPGRGTASLGVVSRHRYTLWLGKDHILAVSNQYFSEAYKRFYFSDIQTITVQKTAAGKVSNIILGAISFLLLVLLYIGTTRNWDIAANITSGFFLGMFFLCLLINWARSATCICYLKTAVQTERLYSLHRLRNAMKTVRRLKEIIEANQGVFSPEHLEAVSGVTDRFFSAPANQPGKAKPGIVHIYKGGAHKWLLITLLVDFCHSGMKFFVQNIFMYFASIAILIGLITTIIVSLVKQYRSNMTGWIKKLPWIIIGYMFISYVLTNIQGMILAIQNPETSRNTWTHINMISTLDPMEHPFMAAILLFSMIGSGILGLSGLVLLNRYRKSLKTAPPPA